MPISDDQVRKLNEKLDELQKTQARSAIDLERFKGEIGKDILLSIQSVQRDVMASIKAVETKLTDNIAVVRKELRDDWAETRDKIDQKLEEIKTSTISVDARFSLVAAILGAVGGALLVWFLPNLFH